MELPIGIDRGRIPDIVSAALRRDHGAAPRVTRAFLDGTTGMYQDFEIGGVFWRYDGAGVLIDAYRWTSKSRGTGRRTEVEHRGLRVRPVALTYSERPAAHFFDRAAAIEADGYESARAGAGPCYEVSSPDGVLGMVVQVRYPPSALSGQPARQWLALDAAGRVWMSYGRTREEAARYLLTDAARRPDIELLAA